MDLWEEGSVLYILSPFLDLRREGPVFLVGSIHYLFLDPKERPKEKCLKIQSGIMNGIRYQLLRAFLHSLGDLAA